MTRTFRHAVAGATAVEFAFIGSAMLLAVFGSIKLVAGMWTWSIIQAVAGETARCLAIGSCLAVPAGCAGTNGAVCHAITLAEQRGLGSLDPSSVSTQNPVPIGGANFAQVDISHDFELLGLALTLTASASFPTGS